MSEIDPDLGAAWRAASREQPPAALDDAHSRRRTARGRHEAGALSRRAALVAARRRRDRCGDRRRHCADDAARAGDARGAPSSDERRATGSQRRQAEARGYRAEARRGVNPVRRSATHHLREEAKPIAKDQKSRAVDETDAGAGRSAGSFAAPPGASARDKKAATAMLPRSPRRKRRSAIRPQSRRRS